jgi:hypothetical protein
MRSRAQASDGDPTQVGIPKLIMISILNGIRALASIFQRLVNLNFTQRSMLRTVPHILGCTKNKLRLEGTKRQSSYFFHLLKLRDLARAFSFVNAEYVTYQRR